MKVNDSKWHRSFIWDIAYSMCCSLSRSDLFNGLLALFDGNRASELLVWFKCLGDLEYEDVTCVNWNQIFRFIELVSQNCRIDRGKNYNDKTTIPPPPKFYFPFLPALIRD